MTESIGLLLMWVLITLSNAGGLSGAGTNIPIMLIFFGMEMTEAVPISGFVAVVATVFRFILNFNQKHPKDKARSSINYEIVQIVMPSVFLGSFIGVTLNQKEVDPTSSDLVWHHCCLVHPDHLEESKTADGEGESRQ